MEDRTYERTNVIYGNYLVQAPDGTMMFRCEKKKADWYLSRNLAELISENPFIIKLNFEPQGKGHIDDLYYLAKKENRCVVCGLDELSELTKHHIVPYEYRKNFPLDVKEHSSHDIVSICKLHHSEYEVKHANTLKKIFEGIHDAPLNITIFEKKTLVMYSYANALFRHGDKMNKTRQTEMIAYIQMFQHDIVDSKLIEKLAKTNVKSTMNLGKRHGEIVYSQIKDNLQEFVETWRQNFTETMNPEFMPIGWDVKRNIKY